MNRSLLIFLLLINKVWAQNLVPNPGFEIYTALPSGPAEYNDATGWNNCNGGGSPDYFSTLGSGLAQLPNCFIGTISPHSGNGCMGAAFYYFSPPDFREYIDKQLSSPMTVGVTYNVSFYISNGVTGGEYGGGGINELSVAFTTNELTQSGDGPISFSPQYIYGGVLYNHSWQLISFQLTADSAYRYLTFGNFKSDAATVYQQFDPCSNYGAYYFFDDVSVQQQGGAPPVASFSAVNTAFCQETCVSFSNLSTNATAWHWLFPGGNPSSDTTASPQTVCYQDSGNFDVMLVAINASGTDTLKLTNYIKVYGAPPTPVITQADTILYCSTDPSYTSYQWYDDTTLIHGATDSSLVISQNGNYNVQVSNSNSCNIAVGINIILGVQNPLQDGTNSNVFTLLPNPVKDKFTIYGSQFTIARMEIYNVLGQVCHQSEIINRQSEIDVSSFPSGVYFIRIADDKDSWTGKFVKE